MKVAIGSNISLDCVTDGFPAPNVTWLKDFRPLNESARISVLSNGTLLLLDVVLADTAAYTCRAASQAGINQVTVAVTVGNYTTSEPGLACWGRGAEDRGEREWEREYNCSNS